jgi:NNP family nitrate/nitrite transporter-like MFS transporter
MSILMTGGPAAASWVFIAFYAFYAFYVVCVAFTWWYYVRLQAEVRC